MGKSFRKMQLRARARPKRRGGRLLLWGAGLALVGWAWFSEWGLGSVGPELTQEAARGFVLGEINRALEAELEEEPLSLVSLERDGAGEVQAVHTDAGALNALRVRLLGRLEEELNGTASLEIPAGSLTGVALLNGRGFPVPLKLRLESSADLSFSTEFAAAGVNQVCHRVTMTVKVWAYSQSKRFPVHVEEEVTTVLAETLLAGQVPQAFVNSG